MKKKISIVLAGILFLAGLSLLLYPLVANQWNNYRQSRLISEYESVVKDESRKGTINYEKEWERANAYNQSLLPSILPDSFAIAAASDKPGEEYMSCLNILTDEMMGYVGSAEDQYQDPDLPHHFGRSTQQRSRSSGRKFPSGRWREYPFGNLCTPWSSKCQSFHRPGSTGRRRSFSDPCTGSDTLLRSGSDPYRGTGEYQ